MLMLLDYWLHFKKQKPSRNDRAHLNSSAPIHCLVIATPQICCYREAFYNPKTLLLSKKMFVLPFFIMSVL